MRPNIVNIEKIGAYNANVSKANFINSLSEDEVKYYDELLGKKIPAESQIAQKAYSRDSNIFNDYYRLTPDKFNEEYILDGLARKKVEKLISDLKKSIIFLKEDLVVFRIF